MQNTWSSWQLRFCTVCIDGDGHGLCRLAVDDECALHAHADKIAQAMNGGEGRSMRIDEIQAGVCAACGRREPDGSCWKQNRLECAFDRFLPVIMETLEGHPAGSA